MCVCSIYSGRKRAKHSCACRLNNRDYIYNRFGVIRRPVGWKARILPRVADYLDIHRLALNDDMDSKKQTKQISRGSLKKSDSSINGSHICNS